MEYEIELIEDGDGIAVLGHGTAVEQFLTSQGIPSQELDLKRLGPAFTSASQLAQTGAEVSAESGRWVKLTKESAAAFHTSRKMTGSSHGVSRAIVTGDKGRIKGVLEIVDGAGPMLTNPAVLTGAAGIMAQMAMQQTMDEITDYLAVIDAKVDDVLRGQKDAVIADMIGVDLALDEAMTVREQVGRVSEVTWSKVQSTSMTIKRTQAYALKQLSGITEKLEKKQSKVTDLADAARDAERAVQEWLAVLAHCFRLQDALGVLELDRVVDTAPDELETHRQGLRLARQNSREQLVAATSSLLERMDAAVDAADAKLLLSPLAAPKVTRSRNKVHNDVIEFQHCLGIAGEQSELEGRRWRDAAFEVRDNLIVTGAESIDTAVQAGNSTLESARLATGKATEGLSRRLLRKRTDDDVIHEDAPRTLTSRVSKFSREKARSEEPEPS